MVVVGLEVPVVLALPDVNVLASVRALLLVEASDLEEVIVVVVGLFVEELPVAGVVPE